MSSNKDTQPIHVKRETHAILKREAEEGGKTIGEVVHDLATRPAPAPVPAAPPPITGPAIPVNLESAVLARAESKGVAYGAALAEVVAAGIKRLSALEKWNKKNKASKPAKEPKPSKPEPAKGRRAKPKSEPDVEPAPAHEASP